MPNLYYLREIAQEDSRLIEEYSFIKAGAADKKELLEQDVQPTLQRTSRSKNGLKWLPERRQERYLAQLQQDQTEEALIKSSVNPRP